MEAFKQNYDLIKWRFIMRKDSLKTIFFIIGIITVFLSAFLYLKHLIEKLTIEFFDDDVNEDFFLEDEEPIEPIIVTENNDD